MKNMTKKERLRKHNESLKKTIKKKPKPRGKIGYGKPTRIKKK